jgi:uncharacterized repeat protein (TIGR03809 family)
MSKAPTRALDEVSHKWRRLAERRQDHLLQLFNSGRWKLYYTEEKFLHLMREAAKLTERWASIAPPSADRYAIMPDAEAADGRTGARRDAA